MDKVKEVLTSEDIIRAGACPSGVKRWCQQHGSVYVMGLEDAIKKASEEDSAYIERAAGVSVSVSVSGDGSGDGESY